MKLYKSLFIVAAIVGIVLTSCSEDGYWKESTPADRGLINGTSFAFDSKTSSYTYYPADVTEGVDIPVTITRGNTQGSFVLPVDVAFSDTSYISGPDSVVFEDGANSATYLIHIKKEIEIGKTVTADLVIDTLSVGIPRVEKPVAPESLDSTATAADSAQYETDYAKFQADSIDYKIYLNRLSAYNLATKVSIAKDYNWVSLGTGTWSDDFFYEVTGIDVEVLQAQENPKIFRVMLDYEAVAEAADAEANGNQSTYTNITLLEEGDELMGASITEPNLVYWTKFKNGYDNSGTDWVYMHPMDFSLNWSRFNNTSYVDSYQENGLPAKIVLSGLILLEGTTQGYAPCQNGQSVATLVFPGVKIYDYSATLQYAGLFTNPDNEVFALADLKITGADAKKAKAMAVVVSGDADASAVADAIAAGDFEATEVKEGRLELPMPEEASGKMQIVVAFIADGEVGNFVTAPFEYYAGENPWKSLGTGYYTEDIIYSTFTQAGATLTYEVEIDESNSTPGLYRLKTPYAYWAEWWGEGNGEEDILIHAEISNGVYIPDQLIGLTYDGTPMSIETRGGYLISANSDYDPSEIIAAKPEAFGKIENGVISFPVFKTQNSAGEEISYQAYLNAGEKFYYVGKNGAISVTLPGASASVRAKAKANAEASKFVKNMMKYSFAGKPQNKSLRTQDKSLKLKLRNMLFNKTQKLIK